MGWEDGRIWDRQIEFLKAHCKLIVPDLPGSGNSDYLSEAALGRTTDQPVSIEDYADLLLALMDHASIEKP